MATDMGGFAQAGGPVLVDQFGRPLAQSRNVLLPPYFRRDDITFDGTSTTILTTNMPVSGTLQIVVRSGTTTRFMEQSEITYSPPSGYTLNYIPATGDIGCVSYFSASPIIGPSTLLTGSDPYWSSVSALLHFDGSTGSTTFLDQKGNTWTPSVSIALDQSQKKFGTASVKCDGWSAFLTGSANSVFGMGTGDYTIELFALVNNTSSNVNTLIDTRTASNTGIQFWIGGGVFSQPPNVIGCSSNSAVLATGGTVTNGTWYHLALCRASGTIKAFLNGTQVFTVADSRTYASSTQCVLGGDYAHTSGQYADGWIDEARITKGIARYTSNFTAPVSAFPNY